MTTGGWVRVCLRASVAVKRHHEQGNSYKGKHFIKASLQFQACGPLSSQWEMWQHTGKHDAGDRAESSTSGSTCSKDCVPPSLGLSF